MDKSVNNFIEMDSFPFIPKKRLERRAQELISAYETATGRPVKPPIPVEIILESHLGLGLEIADLKTLLDKKDVIGATWIPEKKVVIDSSLEQGPRGRFYFTVAHEIGHWVLHRELIQEMVMREDVRSAVVCRDSESRKSGEWQADYFAGALLMPEGMLREAVSRVLNAEKIEGNLEIINRPGGRRLGGLNGFFNLYAMPIIEEGGFGNVSSQAMRVRMQQLGMFDLKENDHGPQPPASEGLQPGGAVDRRKKKSKVKKGAES